MKLALVGISEVAQAHLNAVKKPDAANKRFVLVNETVWFRDYV